MIIDRRVFCKGVIAAAAMPLIPNIAEAKPTFKQIIESEISLVQEYQYVPQVHINKLAKIYFEQFYKKPDYITTNKFDSVERFPILTRLIRTEHALFDTKTAVDDLHFVIPELIKEVNDTVYTMWIKNGANRVYVQDIIITKLCVDVNTFFPIMSYETKATGLRV